MIIGILLQNMGGILLIFVITFFIIILSKGKRKENTSEFSDKTTKNHKRYHL